MKVIDQEVIEFLKADPSFEFRQGVSSESFAIRLLAEMYHANTSAISSSRLKTISRSLAHYLIGEEEAESDEDDKSEKECMRLGTGVHSCTLEPHLFDAESVVWLGKSKTLLKDGYKDLVKAAEGKNIFKVADYKKITGCAQAIRSVGNGIIGEIIDGAEKELSIFWRDQETGIWCKVRPDVLNMEYGIYDVKSTRDAREESFTKDAYNKGYYVSAAMYKDGVSQFLGQDLPFVLVAAELEPPHGVLPYVVDGPALEYGNEVYRRNLRRLQKAHETNEYPNYPFLVRQARLPAWARVED